MTMNLDHELPKLFNVERFCDCVGRDCDCGEGNVHEWAWDETLVTSETLLSRGNLEVKFHPRRSVGTVAVRGNRPMEKGRHHYWEVKMLTPVYGTDVMVGVGTSKADLRVGDTFCSLLGLDRESWGFSYRGYLQHDARIQRYSKCFGERSLVGVHLDTWKGTLQFFLNREPLGLAFAGLRNLELYPMVSSTAARSGVRITHCCSASASLQMDCLSVLRPRQRTYLSAAFPGLRYLSESIFADVLRNPSGEADEDDDYEFPEEFLILDDMDYALVGFGPRRKRKKVDATGPSRDFPQITLKRLEL